MSLLYRFGRFVLVAYLFLWHRVRFEGLEHIPKTGGFIICSNHRTYMDVALLAWKVPRQLFFMAKAELFQKPVLGFLVKRLGAFPVERGKGDSGAVDFAVDTVRGGQVLAMFPEGTRSKDGSLRKGKSGISLIASRSGADVLPVGIRYDDPSRFRSLVTVHVGRRIPNTELHIEDNRPSDIKAATKRIMSEIAALMGVSYE